MLDGSPGSREAEATCRFWWRAPTHAITVRTYVCIYSRYDSRAILADPCTLQPSPVTVLELLCSFHGICPSSLPLRVCMVENYNFS